MLEKNNRILNNTFCIKIFFKEKSVKTISRNNHLNAQNRWQN